MTLPLSLATRSYFKEIRTKRYVKEYGLLSFPRNLSNKYGKQLLDTALKTGLDALKPTAEKVVQKATWANGEFIGNKIAGKIVKPPENSIDAEERHILTEKRILLILPEEILNELKKVL